MPYDFQNPTADTHLFMSTAGSRAAREYMLTALRNPDFPRKFRGRATGIYRRIVDLDAELEAFADDIRRRTASSESYTPPKSDGHIADATWAEQAMTNAVRALKGAVRKGGREYVRALDAAEGILADMVSLVRDLREYAEGFHPLDWAARVVDDLVGDGHGGMDRLAGTAGSDVTVEDVVRAQVGDLLLLHEDDFHGVTYGWMRVGDRKTEWVRVIQNGSAWVPVADRSKPGEEFVRITRLLGQGRRMTLSRPRIARGNAKKDVGHGGLDEWFSGHGEGKGKAEGEATWGDWVAISPVKKKIERELADGTVKEKTVQPGDIVGPCGVSDDPNWKDVTRDGKDPLKCMPRQKAHDMPRKERAELAREKMRAERDEGNRGKKPTRTPTFDKEASDPVVAGDNEPTNPSLWEKAKAEAKERYTKWPSAYAVGHALKIYKDEGGGWRKKAGWWESESGNLIGDGPADVMQDAVEEVREMYRSHPEIGREPTLEELWGTVDFVTGPAMDRGELSHQATPVGRVGATAKRQVQYKGRPYNLLWSGPTKYGDRAHLQFLDGSKDFWVDAALVSGGGTSPRSYAPRLRRDGTYECEECGEYVRPGTQCWETGMRH